MIIINRQYMSKPLTLPIIITALLFSTSACSNQSATDTNADLAKYQEAETSVADVASTDKPAFTTKAVATFDEPWAMTALPKVDNKPLRLLVTQKTGELFIVNTATGAKTAVVGVPRVAYGGQGGLGDGPPGYAGGAQGVLLEALHHLLQESRGERGRDVAPASRASAPASAR